MGYCQSPFYVSGCNIVIETYVPLSYAVRFCRSQLLSEYKPPQYFCSRQDYSVTQYFIGW